MSKTKQFTDLLVTEFLNEVAFKHNEEKSKDSGKVSKGMSMKFQMKFAPSEKNIFCEGPEEMH